VKVIAMLIAAAAVLVWAPTAVAGVTFVPPGNSSAGEYSDIVPTSGGDRPGVSFPGSPDGGHGGGASPRTVSKLNALGSAGRAAARFAASTAPVEARRARVQPRGLAAAESRDTSPLSAIVKLLTGGSSQGGSGLLLPLTLLIAAAAVSAVALVRRRRIS
jgi:hypothetical protein